MHIPRSECSVKGVFDMDNIKASNVLLSVHNDTCPAHIASTSNHNNVSGIEPDEIGDLVLFDIIFDGVVDLNGGVGVADGSPVVGDDVWDALRSKGHFSNLKKLVGGFLGCDAVDGEATLDIVKKAEVFTRLLNGNDV